MEEGSRLCNITEQAAFNMEDVGTGSSSNFLHDFETKMHNLGDRIRIKSDAFQALPSPQCLLPSTFTTSAQPAIIIFQAAILLHIGTTQAINILPQSPDARLPLEGHVGPDKRPINRKFPIFFHNSKSQTYQQLTDADGTSLWRLPLIQLLRLLLPRKGTLYCTKGHSHQHLLLQVASLIKALCIWYSRSSCCCYYRSSGRSRMLLWLSYQQLND